MDSDRKALLVGSALVAVAAGLPLLMSMWKRRQRRPATPPADSADWQLVGSLAKVIIYPVKSGKYIDLNEAQCTPLGLSKVPSSKQEFLLRDRYFILFREDDGDMVTARANPKLLQLSMEAHGKDSVRLKYPNKPDLILTLPTSEMKTVTMWRSEKVECLDCGEEAAEWLTRAVKSEDTTARLRLGAWPSSRHQRDVVGAYKGFLNPFTGTTNMDAGWFTDMTSYMLMTSSSLEEVGRRTEGCDVTVRQFRPNLFVQTDEKPFSELTWKWVKIGDNIFRFVKGCVRCAMTTINPETGKRYPNNEPLKTLTRMPEAKVTRPIDEEKILGIHLGLHQAGTIRVGDPVYVIR